MNGRAQAAWKRPLPTRSRVRIPRCETPRCCGSDPTIPQRSCFALVWPGHGNVAEWDTGARSLAAPRAFSWAGRTARSLAPRLAMPPTPARSRTCTCRLARRSPFAAARVAGMAGRKEEVFAVAVTVLAAKLCKADGPVKRSEIDAFKRSFRIPPESARIIGRLFDQARDSNDPFEPYAAQLGQRFSDDRGTLEDVLRALFAIARADGPLNAREQTYLRGVHRGLRLDESGVEKRIRRSASPIGRRAKAIHIGSWACPAPPAVTNCARLGSAWCGSIILTRWRRAVPRRISWLGRATGWRGSTPPGTASSASADCESPAGAILAE